MSRDPKLDKIAAWIISGDAEAFEELSSLLGMGDSNAPDRRSPHPPGDADPGTAARRARRPNPGKPESG